MFSTGLFGGEISASGQAIYDNLKAYSCVLEANVEDGPTAIPLEIIDLAAEFYSQSPRPHESELISLYTPYLKDVVRDVSSDLRLVNSECYPWIQYMSGYHKYDLKPDMFSAYHLSFSI